MQYVVRTLFLSKFFMPAREVVELRRHPNDMQALITAMKRLEIADDALAKELNSFAEKGYRLVDLIVHPTVAGDDLIATAIFTVD